MGRATEFFDYINRDYEPNKDFCRDNYFGINERDYFELRRKLARERKKKNQKDGH
jgi:hypothetical protein